MRLIIISLLASFLNFYLVVFHLSLRNSKSPQFIRILLINLANLINTVCKMVSILPLISCFSYLFSSLRVPFSVGQLLLVSPSLSYSIAVFSSLEWSRYLYIFLLSFYFVLWFAETATSTIRQVLFESNYSPSSYG